MIGFDIDSVVLDTYPVARKYFLNKYNIDFKIDEHKMYNFNLPINADPTSDFEEICSTIMMKPLGDAFEVIELIYSMTGEKIYFVTARSQVTKKNTISNIYKYIDPLVNYEIYFTDGKPKNTVLKRLGIDVFVDDRFKTCNQLAGKIKTVFCLSQPWNMGRELDSCIIRIDKIWDIFRYIGAI